MKVWHVPDGGLSGSLTEWLVDLRGHKRRVSYIEWHPTAENVLISAGLDHLVRLEAPSPPPPPPVCGYWSRHYNLCTYPYDSRTMTVKLAVHWVRVSAVIADFYMGGYQYALTH